MLNPTNNQLDVFLPTAKVGRVVEFIVIPTTQDDDVVGTAIDNDIIVHPKTTNDIIGGSLPLMSLYPNSNQNRLLFTSSNVVTLSTNSIYYGTTLKFVCYTTGKWVMSGLGLSDFNND